MKAMLLSVGLLAIPSLVSAEVVVPSVCPEGYIHEGAECVLREGGRVIEYPFSYFEPGGRFFRRGGFVRSAPRGVARPLHRGGMMRRK